MDIIFDFDGTLHQTEGVYSKAMEKTLANEGLFNLNLDYRSLIGQRPGKVWEDLGFFGEKEEELVRSCGAYMEDFLESYGELFPGTLETLANLKKSYDLYLLSNSKASYIRKALKIYGLEKYFQGVFLGEDFSYPGKGEILRRLSFKNYTMIGDRREDIEAGLENGEGAIFASYGYGRPGEGEGADFSIGDIGELLEIFQPPL